MALSVNPPSRSSAKKTLGLRHRTLTAFAHSSNVSHQICSPTNLMKSQKLGLLRFGKSLNNHGTSISTVFFCLCIFSQNFGSPRPFTIFYGCHKNICYRIQFSQPFRLAFYRLKHALSVHVILLTFLCTGYTIRKVLSLLVQQKKASASQPLCAYSNGNHGCFERWPSTILRYL